MPGDNGCNWGSVKGQGMNTGMELDLNWIDQINLI